ncbi:Alpha-1,2-mannosyltransferase MNN5 [Nakaseomyces bracarensis]|uniref:Alpha-1,2-mannosyltransferase MNN5 n=1 Tax=Nakaseomyces bracarensis TaxID=273131 RepID=A0ABR4NZ68_9SACH
MGLKRSKGILIGILVIIVVWRYLYHVKGPMSLIEAEDPALSQFYLDLFKTVNQYRPTTPPSNQDKLVFKQKCTLDRPIEVTDNSEDSLGKLSYKTLDYCFHLSPSQTANLRTAHNGYIKRVQELFGGPDEALLQMLAPKSKGIVTIANEQTLLALMSSIPRLRSLGSKLPIEVMFGPMATRENEFCQDFLPKFNGRCVYMADLLPRWAIKEYTFDDKTTYLFVPLVSDFKSILYMDGNHFAEMNLDSLFTLKPYMEEGLVLWPSNWRKTISPVFYKISDGKIDLNKRVRNANDDVSSPSRYMDLKSSDLQFELLSRTPMHDLDGAIPDPATHPGVYMLDKEKHFKTVLLSIYYRINGKMWFDKMFASEDPQRGHHDSFVAAAHALGKPYHQVRMSPTQRDDVVSHIDPSFDQEAYDKLLERIQTGAIDVAHYDSDYETTTFDKMMKTAAGSTGNAAFIEFPKSHFHLTTTRIESLRNDKQEYNNLYGTLCVQRLKLKFIEDNPSTYDINQICTYLDNIAMGG